MRIGSVCSIALHGSIVAAFILWAIPDDGGAPDIGGGGAQAIEVVLYSADDGTNAETPTEAEAEIAEEDAEATQVAAQPQPRRPSTPTPPPPPAAAVAPPVPTQVAEVEELPPIVAPLGDEAIVPPIPADMVQLPDDLESVLVPPQAVKIEVEMPEELEVALEPPPKPVETEVKVEVPMPEDIDEILEPPPEPVEVRVELPENLEELLDPPPVEPVPEQVAEPLENIVPPEKPTREVKLPDVKQALAKRKEAPKEEPKQQEQQEAGTPGQQLAVAPQKGTANGTEATPSDAGAESVGVAAGKLQSYNGLLLAWLEKHKRYPDAARRRKHEGTVTIEFTIDGSGNVVKHRIVSDSGYELLDAEANELLQRASPLPPPPQEVTQRTWQVPINFELN